MKNLIIVGVYICLVLFLTGSVSDPDPYILAGKILGAAAIPLFNAHLTRKYLNMQIIKKYPLISMLIVGTISLFINSAIPLLIILGAIGINKLTNKKPKAKTT